MRWTVKPMEAMRCLRRRLSDVVYRQLVADAARPAQTVDRAAGPGGHSGTTTRSSATDLTPDIGSSDQPLPGASRPRPTPVDVEVAAYERGQPGLAVITSPLTDQSLIGAPLLRGGAGHRVRADGRDGACLGKALATSRRNATSGRQC
jgi:hypothetical protein